MATGRTKPKWTRVYADGYNLSGYARSIGPLEITYDEHDMTTLSESTKGYLPGTAHVNIGTLNAVFDNTATTGLQAAMGTAGSERQVTVAYGIRAAPAAGDPAFCGQFTQGAFQVSNEGGVYVNIPFQGWAADGTTLKYGAGWGQLLHAYGAETGANTGTGVDNEKGAATAKGGFLIYHIFALNAGTATISVDDSANNTDFLALSGATSGAIAAAAVPTSGIVALGNAADVRQYLRWQLALAGGANTCTFVLSFVRAF